MRSIEVYYNIGFQRVGQGAIDGIMVIPGILSMYRRELLTELGGFSAGLNGEDTDMTVRIGRLGYRIIIDPGIHVFSEVPRTLGHLREQRLRWMRGLLHVIARNSSAIWMLQGVRGLWTLPYAYVIAIRRVILVPILVYAAMVALIEPSALFLRGGAAVGAMLVGPAFLMTVGVLIVYRRLDLVPFIPAYLGLRVIRAYVGLDMLFTLPLKSMPSVLRMPAHTRTPTPMPTPAPARAPASSRIALSKVQLAVSPNAHPIASRGSNGRNVAMAVLGVGATVALAGGRWYARRRVL